MIFEDLVGSHYAGNNQTLKHLYQQNQKYFDELMTQLQRNTVVPLFGAGFSGSAYPGWASLLRKIAAPYPNCQDDLEQHLNAGEFEEAASLLCEEMGDFMFQEELSNAFGPHTLPSAIQKISEARKAIPQIFTGPLVTTNVEQVLEELYQRKLPVLCPHTSYHQSQAERALQSSSPVLFKLHGDIGDPEHVIFTKEAYDNVYQNLTDDSTLVQTLKQIFSAKTVLFLGCSLETDRVLKVLEHCCDNHVYYALAELPEETKNEDNPFNPNLLNEENKEQSAYRSRRKFMSNHHIKCIWYPHGQYNALDVFLRELQNRLGPSPQHPSSIPAARRKILGRDQAIDTVYQHCMTGNCPVFVTGPGGIGKTEVCHMVLRRMEEAGKSILYVNVTNLREPATLCHMIARATDADPMPDDKAVNLPAYLEYIKGKISAHQHTVLYLDNWEDLWFATKGQDNQRLQLLEWMTDLCRCGTPVLLSSRVYPEEYDVTVTTYPLPALDQTSGVDKALFQQVYQSKNGHLLLKGDSYEKLLKQLDGHPLAIVLTATQAAGAPNWDSVLARWTNASQKTSNPRHSRLDTALQMSWDAVSGAPGCIMVWGLVALSRDDLAFQQLLKLADSPAEQQQWEESVRLLRAASLLDWSEDEVALQMLQPIKEAFFLLANQEEGLPCFERWYQFFLPILKQANNRKDHNRQIAHVQVVEQLPQILYLLDHMLAHSYQNYLIVHIIKLTENVLNYFQYSTIQSLSICEKLENILPHSRYQPLLAHIMERHGYLISRLGGLGQAEQMYQQAEILYRQECDNLGLANIFKSRGDLFSRRGNPEQAKEMYQQAETLYHQEHVNLGLANTLRSLGNLFSRLGNLDKADEMYQQAETLYHQEHVNLGLANTLRSRGNLFSRLGNLDKAQEIYQQAETLYRQEHDNLGLANTLQSRGDLFSRLCNLDKAEEIYQQAEIIYQQEHDNLGLANTLKSRGDLFSRLNNLNKAEEMYQQAETLYRQEQDNLGLANTFQSWGNLFRYLDNLDRAEDMYRQAEKLFRQEQDNLGLANTFKGWGDLFCRLGDLDKAEDMYRQAEKLFQQEQDNLGLANTLRNQSLVLLSKGDEAGAVNLLRDALSHYQSEQEPYGSASTCAILSVALVESESHSDEAAALAKQAKEIAETLPSAMKEHVLALLDP